MVSTRRSGEVAHRDIATTKRKRGGHRDQDRTPKKRGTGSVPRGESSQSPSTRQVDSRKRARPTSSSSSILDKPTTSSHPDSHTHPSTSSPDLSHPIRSTLHTLLLSTRQGGTVCPSSVPRSLHASSPSAYPDWRGLMPRVREEVWALVKEKRVEVTQRGERRAYEDRDALKGPIRVKKGEKWDGWDGT